MDLAPSGQGDSELIQPVAEPGAVRGRVFHIQKFSVHDGPGIRTIVFMKGCSLRCQWCDNPESLSPRPEIGFIRARCTSCGRCVEACPLGALALDSDVVLRIDRDLCDACGKCVGVCYPKVLVLYGREMTAAEVFESVRRDQIYYRSSGGGVTASGGDALLQPAFLCALFQLCRDAGINTAIETAGFVKPEVLKRVLALTDYVLFDLKLLDPLLHEEYTGQQNDLILANARLVAGSGVPTQFRMPLIPGVNDSPENIRDTAAFLCGLGGDLERLELMPYHRLGEGKYEALDRSYPMAGLAPVEPALVDRVRRAFEELGVRCSVSR